MDENEDSGMSRRLFGGAGLGLAIVAGTSAAAQAGQPAAEAPMPLEDPASKYPSPPFKRQLQAWPGLAGQMDPKPDHGETSYRGSEPARRPPRA